MATTSNIPSNNQHHDELDKRFKIFKATAGTTGQPYNIVKSHSIKDNRLYAQIIPPSGYADDFWEMVANDLTRHFLTLTNKGGVTDKLKITVALLEGRWLSFAEQYEVETESVIPFLNDEKQPCLVVNYIQVFPIEEDVKSLLSNRQLSVIKEFEPEGLVHRMILQAFMY